MPLYVEENNNIKKVNEFYINNVIISSVLKGYIGINGLSKIFYDKNSYSTKIPEEYTRIPYILNNSYIYNDYVSKNMTYINTGIKGYKCIEFKAESTSETGIGYKAGPHPTLYINDHFFVYFRTFGTGSSDNAMHYHYYSYKTSSAYRSKKSDPFFGKYYIKNGKYHAETTGSYGYTMKTDHDMIEEDNNILLLGIPSSTNLNTRDYEPGEERANTKLYYCKIYEDSTKTKILRDFIPVRRNSDGRLGLFDLVTQTFFDNECPGYESTNFILNDYVRSYLECPSYAVCNSYDSCSKVHIFYPNDCYNYIPCDGYSFCNEYTPCDEYDSSIPQSCSEYNPCELYSECEEYTPCEEHELCKAYGCNKYYYCKYDSCNNYDFCNPYDSCSVLNKEKCKHIPCIEYDFCSDLEIPCGTYTCSSYDFSPNECDPFKVGASSRFPGDGGYCNPVNICSGFSCTGVSQESGCTAFYKCRIVTCASVTQR